MTRVENARRSFQKFVSDEGLDRLLDEILYAIDIEGIVASVQEQLHEIAENSFIRCQYLGEEGNSVQQSYLHFLDESLSLVYAAVKLRLAENSAEIKEDLRNFIAYVVRNKRRAYDYSFLMKSRLDLVAKLFYTIQSAAVSVLTSDRLYYCAEQAFADRELTAEENQEKELLEQVLQGLHYFVVRAVCDGLEARCDKALAIVEQVVTSECDSVIEKLFHVEGAAASLAELLEMDDEWLSKVFGEDDISYLSDALRKLKRVIDTVAPYVE